MKNFIIQDKIYKILSVIFWLIVWQSVCTFIGDKLFLASPFETIKTLLSLVFTRDFWLVIINSSLRIVSGFLLAFTLGIILAILSSAYNFFNYLLNPIINIIKSTPVASFIILALLWIGSENLSLLISFLMVLPIIYSNVLQQILHTPKEILEMAKVFNISITKKILYVYIPQVTPTLISACSVGLGLCWKSGVAAEVIGQPAMSIGERLYMAKIWFSTGELFAWTLVIILLSIIFEKVFMFLLKKILILPERLV